MKKLLTATLAIAMGATIAGVVTGCTTNEPSNTPTDAETAEVAIGILRSWYAGDKEETDTDYPVAGKVQANENIYDVTWTVNPDASCTVENFGNYVKLSELNTDTDQYTVQISNAEVKIEYTLTASVTVGEVTKTIDFKHYVPVGRQIIGEITKGSLTPGSDTAQPGASDEQAVFKNGELSLTKDKYNSSSAVNPSYPDRCYQGSKVTIAYPGILQLKLTSDKSYTDGDKVTNYPQLLKSSIEAAIWDGVTVSVNEETLLVTVNFETPVDSFEFIAKTQIRIKEINVTGQAGGSTAQNKVDGAKAQLALDTTEYSAIGTYDLPATKNGANITWSVKETSEYVSVNSDGKLVVGKLPTADTPVVLVANISVGTDASATKEITIKLAPIAGVSHAGTKDDPYKPSEALIMAGRLGDKEYSGTVYVTGYVVKCTEYKTDFKNFDAIYIVDTYAADKDETSADALYIFRPAPDGTYLTTAGLNKGDLVTFEGKLQNYSGTLELTSGKCIAHTTPVDERTDAEKAAAALDAFVKAYNNKTITGNVSLTSSVTGVTLTITNSTNTDVIATTGTVTRPETDTEVTLTIKATCGSEQPTQTVTITVKAEVKLTGAGTETSPYTVADVKSIAAGLASGGYLGGSTAPTLVYVKGYVVAPGSWSSSHSNYTGVYIVDEYAADKDGSSTDALQIYGLKGSDGIVIDETHPVQHGDFITVTGYIQNHSSGYQITYKGSVNPTCVAKTSVHEGATDSEKAAAALDAFVNAYNNKTITGNVSLTSSVTGVTLTITNSTNTDVIATTGTVTRPATDTEVTLTIKATCGSEQPTQDVTVTVKAQLQLTGDGTVNNPYTVADVQTILSGVGSDSTQTYYNGDGSSPVLVHVKGYVVAPGTWNSNNSNYTGVYIVDEYAADKTSSDGLQVYGLQGGTAVTLDATHSLQKGEYIVLTGYLQNRFGSYQVTYNSETNPTVVEYQGASNATKVEAALAAVGELSVIDADGPVPLPASTVDGVTFTWSFKAGCTYDFATCEGNVLNVNELPAENTVVHLTLTATCGTGDDQVTDSLEDVTVTVNKHEDNTVSATLDFTDKYSTYASSWGNSYSKREFGGSANGYSLATLGESDVKGTVELSNASNQSSTSSTDAIKDRPVLASKANDQYVTVTVTNGTITSVKFNLTQWGTKIMTNIYIEYYNGTEWVKCSADITTPGTISNNVALPEGVTQVRLYYKGGSSKNNQQMGLTSIELKVVPTASSDDAE